jgi:hypothetical protein
MKDALVQAALSYKELLDTEYEFKLGTSSRKMIVTLISSTKGEFLHTVGLHHLEDIARFQTKKIYEKEIIFKDICKGKITMKNLSEQSKMLKKPISCSINPRTGNCYCVEDRIIALENLAAILDNAYSGSFHKWEQKNARTVTKEGTSRSSKISADYLLAVPTEIKGENIFIFLRIDNRDEAAKDKSVPIKLSIFSAFPDTAALQNGQHKYTILEESKISKSTGEKEQLYILPSYNSQLKGKN